MVGPCRANSCALAALASVVLGLFAAGAGASPYPLPLICEPGVGLTAGYVALDSEDGVSADADGDDCSSSPRVAEVRSVDALGAVRHRLESSSRVYGELAEVTNDLTLEVDEGAAGSLSATASASVLVSVDGPADVIFWVRREGSLGEVLAATLEGPGGVESFDFSDEPEGPTVVRLDPPRSSLYFIGLNASSASLEAGSSRQSLSVEVYAPEPGAPLLLAAGALVLRWVGALRRGVQPPP